MNKTVFSLIFLLASCFLTGTEPDFYVWQRHHTSEVQQAVEELNEIMKTKAEDQRKQTQRKMFDAVKKNDLKEAEKCLLQGADVYSAPRMPTAKEKAMPPTRPSTLFFGLISGTNLWLPRGDLPKAVPTR